MIGRTMGLSPVVGIRSRAAWRPRTARCFRGIPRAAFRPGLSRQSQVYGAPDENIVRRSMVMPSGLGISTVAPEIERERLLRRKIVALRRRENAECRKQSFLHLPPKLCTKNQSLTFKKTAIVEALSPPVISTRHVGYGSSTYIRGPGGNVCSSRRADVSELRRTPSLTEVDLCRVEFAA